MLPGLCLPGSALVMHLQLQHTEPMIPAEAGRFAQTTRGSGGGLLAGYISTYVTFPVTLRLLPRAAAARPPQPTLAAASESLKRCHLHGLACSLPNCGTVGSLLPPARTTLYWVDNPMSRASRGRLRGKRVVVVVLAGRAHTPETRAGL